MTFTESQALQVIETWGLSPETIRVWRHRGTIPDEYASPPAPVRDRIVMIDEEWYAGWVESLSDLTPEGRARVNAYLLEHQVPQDITEQNLKQRLRDLRRKLLEKYTNTTVQ